jgi:hypothetical protein
MKNIFFKVAVLSLLFCSSCSYLDIVPPNISTIDDAFQNETEAQKSLYGVYSYMPNFSHCRNNIDWVSSDEFVHNGDNYWFPAVNIYTGENSATQPTANFWSHFYMWRINYPMYEGIRSAYLFLQKVDGVPGLSDEKKKEWKAEANFLIAFYHYTLLKYYGPIVIVDKYIPLTTSQDEMMQSRSTYDECVDWIAKKFDEAIPDLPTTVASADYGKPTKAAALAIKSRMLLYAASPLFNGNTEFYADFKGKDGTNLISQTYDKEKWKKALDAAQTAIDAATAAGCALYDYPKSSSSTDAFQHAVDNARYTMVDPWNKELIWGYSGWNENQYQENSFQCLAAPRIASGGLPYELYAPTLSVASMYYTDKGLPIDADPDFDYANRFTNFTEVDGEMVANFNLHREPRYYACIGYDRGYYEINNTKIRLKMRYKEQHGKPQNSVNFSVSGFLVKKGVHPQTVFESQDKRTVKTYPFPIIRLSELYLNYMEAYVEYYGKLDGQALTYLDMIRKKNGLPTWESVKGLATRTITDLETVRTERLVELAFEGHHFQDYRRWCLGDKYLNGKTTNLDINQTTYQKFWRTIKSNEKYDRIFRTPQDYLQPIYVEDIKINPNLVQNPGY